MRQVCIEASNESFAGNFGFYEQKKDEGEDKKKERQAGSEGITLMEKDRKSAKEQHLSNTWEDHSTLYPQREDTRFEEMHGSNAGSGGVRT